MRRHLLLAAILLSAAIARFVLLFESQTHVHHDEAIIGLMGKHILEGRYFPFYMYGQPYNAAAAWEAYLAAIAFAVFGVGVLSLKSCIVMLSLACLGLFYWMVFRIYGQRTAVLATLVFSLAPSLLKWHFQVRGYSWYFLSIPVLVGLFFLIESSSPRKVKNIFLLGLVSGLSLWGLELGLTLIAALWILLAMRRKLSATNAVVGTIGFLIGYAPTVVFNITHHFRNWRYAFIDKPASHVWVSLLRPSTLANIFFLEMPKFFGPDTVFWYYPEIPVSGAVLYVIALLAAAVAILPFLSAPSKICEAFFTNQAGSNDNKDFVMLLLTAACLVPYLAAPLRVPGYFLGGCFFLSILIGRLLERCFVAPSLSRRLVGGSVLLAIVFAGVGAIIEMGSRNQVETLIWIRPQNARLTRVTTRIPGRDIEAVERHLHRNQISFIQVTFPLIYPLLFESGETLAVSDPIFGWERRVYPPGVPMPVPVSVQREVFVIDINSPFRPFAERQLEHLAGSTPLITQYGTLAVIEAGSGK